MGTDAAYAYPVLFREAGALPVAGSLTVTPDRLVLEGGGAGDRRSIRIELGALREIRIARGASERLNGHRVLVLARTSGTDVHVAPLGPGLLHEIADLTASLAGLDGRGSSGRSETAAVAVRLRPDAATRVRELVAAGPPFDPAELELTGHRVVLHGDEVLFVFTGVDVRRKIREISREPRLWRAGMSWRGTLAGAPRLLEPGAPLPEDAELVYEWVAD